MKIFSIILLFLLCISSAFGAVDSGYIYVISNPHHKRMIYKIGMTRQANPHKRIKQLYTTSDPAPFNLKMLIYSDSVAVHERAIHKRLKQYRINPKREFFKMSLKKIKKVVEEEVKKAP